jgi:metal-responsive CopG/Arc/MetJ family transcriptional regulator
LEHSGSKTLNEALEAAIKRNWHRTKAEFIRELVRQELKKRGFHAPGEHPITFEE